VNCATLSEPFQGNVLGEGNVGIIVLDVFGGDMYDIMSHK
jgi:hypothetical protein